MRIDFSEIVIIFTLLGGLGIFLVGLIIMTKGLQSIAGESLRNVMLHFTKSPYSGALGGAFMTTILQSSSATTVTAVGFVGAGIITFSQSLGIIFGANIGSTFTGWIVALFGFKFNLGIIVLPLIFLGAMLKLFGKNNISSLGFAIAGFGLIFVGIDTMQESVKGFERILSPEIFPNDSISGRLLLIGIGIVVTMITQASSAGIAITLTLLFGGAVNFEQAAALVIGMDVGTTVTAAMATIGGNINARRTGFSHVIYNCMSAIFAFMFISPYIAFCEYINPEFILLNGGVALVAFHSSFNIITVLLILPFTNIFANFIKRIIKEKNDYFRNNLDDELLKEPRLALNATLKSVLKEYIIILEHISAIIDEKSKYSRMDVSQMQSILDDTHRFIDRIHIQHKDSPDWDYLVDIIHIIDHLQRLHERCDEEEDRIICAIRIEQLKNIIKHLYTNILDTILAQETNNWNKVVESSKELNIEIEKIYQSFREEVANQIASGNTNVAEGSDKLEAIRWLHRVVIHIYRINNYIHKAILASGK
jgi:phosphate:Na+ symporter